MNKSVKILGNRIDCFKGYREFYDHVLENIKTNSIQRGYITVNNVHTMIEGYWNSSYQAIINNGYLSIPDGKPLEMVGKLKGNKNISRLFGPSVMERFIDWGREDGISHFFFGSSEATLLKMKDTIEKKYPGVKIAGMLSPPFKPLAEWDSVGFISTINNFRPDFIWVGLGAPKQEHWMFQYYKELNKGIMFGIGAGFDYLAGNTKHAPKWMKNASLEWLYRLVQEPQRLWKRYLTIIPQFILFSTLELLGIKLKKTNKSSHY
ncbi:MAG TPA: WecB/TagA/CpsF family glycosyltransferase [Chitinophagaceae bacterium]|jgi:N-acetylglucosaminyldiphosphoundecaprenol N-acetyl-beta-D-mannosaminyltransferase|nr:WecB/TagA/CpsF family glycosyltransferase [Chitinophagaceae bacterium]